MAEMLVDDVPSHAGPEPAPPRAIASIDVKGLHGKFDYTLDIAPLLVDVSPELPAARPR